MEHRLKYFLFNKDSDYTRGYLQNMKVEQGGISAGREAGQRAFFISRLLDSQESEMSWHRLCIPEGEGQQPFFCLSIYAGNQRRLIYQGREMELEELICRDDITVEAKKETMAPWLQKQAARERDILLHEVKGRYLWLLIEMYGCHDGGGLRDIQIFFPRKSWIEHLPEIYKKEDRDSFLERFLGIFQTVYEDFNEELRRVPDYFDCGLAEGDMLPWLGEWLGIRESHIWSGEQQRRLVENGVSLYKRRGTRQGIMDFVELYTGERPLIVEHHEMEHFRKDRRRYECMARLYGRDCYLFTVMVREQAVGSVWQQKTLKKILEGVKPAQMECSLVILRPYIFLGRYSYLGINSVLEKYTEMVLDGHAAIPFAVLGESQER